MCFPLLMFLVFSWQDSVIVSRPLNIFCSSNYYIQSVSLNRALMPTCKALSYQLVSVQLVVFEGSSSKPTVSRHGMAVVLFCPCLCGTHRITWQSNYKWMWDNELTKPAWKHRLMYYIILPHNAIMCIMITFYKEKPANSCLSIEGCTRNCLCCETMRTDHLYYTHLPLKMT